MNREQVETYRSRRLIQLRELFRRDPDVICSSEEAVGNGEALVGIMASIYAASHHLPPTKAVFEGLANAMIEACDVWAAEYKTEGRNE